MEAIKKKYEDFENNFEQYLISDREKFLYDRYKIDDSFKRLDEYFGTILDDLRFKSQGLDELIDNFQNKKIPSIFICLCLNEKDKLKADAICKQFLGMYIDVLIDILECLTIENVVHSQYYSHGSQKTPRFEQFQNASKELVDQIIEALSKCLSFSNKNVPENRAAFEKLKETNPDIYFLISNLRIVGYIVSFPIRLTVVK